MPTPPDIEWQLNLAQLNSDALCPLAAEDLKRTLSNLINNACEAVGGTGTIELGAETLPDGSRIWVKDNGSGVSPDLISKLGNRGFSFGKKNGHGLGVSHAKATVERAGGTFQIVSPEAQGTTVILRF
ncbi:ATP-binding protein [bacterium]|nr:ATP-binding protein [bacterium]